MADPIGIHMAGSTRMHRGAMTTNVAARNLHGFGNHGAAL